MNDDQNQLMSYLKEIASRSIDGEIEWTQPNPATFNWSAPKFLVVLQRAASPKLGLRMGEEEENFLFQVLDKTTRQPVVSLSSKERPEFARALALLYRAAAQGMDTRASNVLRQLLER